MRRLLVAAVALGGLVFSSSAASAQDPFSVVAVPWVGTAPTIPHDAVAGDWFWLQAVAQGDCADTIQYRWDYDGNDTFDLDWADAASAYNLGVKHTYPDIGQTRQYVARVEARCGALGEAVSANFYVKVHDSPTQGQQINRAVSNGLWYGHTQLARDANTRTAAWGHRASTAVLAQAMMNRGHRSGVESSVDPYVEDVQWSVHSLLSEFRAFHGVFATGLAG